MLSSSRLTESFDAVASTGSKQVAAAVLLFASALLIACDSDTPTTPDGPSLSIAMPAGVRPAQLTTGTLQAFISVDGGPRTPLTVDLANNRVTGSVTVGTGSHNFRILFDFQDDDFGVVTIAEATQAVTVGTGTSVSFAANEYTFPDDDGDGFSNAAELGARSDPRSASAIPAMLFMADKLVDETFELFRVDLEGNNLVRLSGDLVAGGDVVYFALSPDRSMLAYTADQDVDGVVELYVTPSNVSMPVEVSGALVAGGDVFGFYWAPDSSRLAYFADQDTDGVIEIYTTLPSGNGSTKVSGSLVAGGQTRLSFRVWAPDSSYIAFEADKETDEVDELYTVRPDGTNLTKISHPLTAGENVIQFEWAPDSSRVAYFTRDDLGNTYQPLHVVFPDGSGNTLVSTPAFPGGGLLARGFAWAPDSSQFVYQVENGDQFNFPILSEIVTALPDGSNQIRVSTPQLDFVSLFGDEWSPVGSRIAYSGTINDNGVFTDNVFTVSTDGSDHTQITNFQSGESINFHSWSPDSTMIAYDTFDDVLHIAAQDGTRDVPASQPSEEVCCGRWFWAPNNSRLAYNDTAQGVLRSVLPDGTGHREVSGPTVSGGGITRFRWVRDSSRIIYRADQDIDETFEIYSSLPDGSNNKKISGSMVAGGGVIDFELF